MHRGWAHTILGLCLRLVQYYIVDIEIGNVTHIEGHDMIVAYANVIVGDFACAIGLRAGGWQ